MNLPSCLSLLLVGTACTGLLSGCATIGARSETFEYAAMETFPLPASGMIRLRSEDAGVTVTGSDRTDVRIEVRYVISAPPDRLARFTYRVNAAETDGALFVAEERNTGTQNFTYDKQVHEIIVEVPRHAHVTLQEEDGNCVIRGVAGRVHVSMDDGRLHLEDCSGDITVAMDDGSLTQKNCAALNYAPR